MLVPLTALPRVRKCTLLRRMLRHRPRARGLARLGLRSRGLRLRSGAALPLPVLQCSLLMRHKAAQRMMRLRLGR